MENYNFLGGLGLLIAGFGGHAIIPSLAIDMKSPEKFDRVVNWAFVSGSHLALVHVSYGTDVRSTLQFIASVVFAISGVAGYLMFGDKVSDAIIKDLLLPEYGFSIPLNQIATWMIVSRYQGWGGFFGH
jgi:vesicular inhibitory amino acid transporter